MTADDDYVWPDEPIDYDSDQPTVERKHGLRAVTDDDPAGNGIDGAVQYRLQALRINAEARRLLEAEQRPPLVIPPFRRLAELLAEPDSPIQFQIDDVAPIGSRILLAAQYKAGKTTIVGNLIRSLVDGDPFLDRFAVRELAHQCAVLDNELSENMVRHWLREQGIKQQSAVSVQTLRGRVGTFNILDDECRSQWAAALREIGADYLIFDCLRPVLDALGLSEDKDAGRFLVAFDALLAEAEIPAAVVVHHMGHSNERSRGDSRLQDWPDAIWRVVRETEEPTSERYFSAFGRDVDVREGRLAYNAEGRRLSFMAGTRSDVKAEGAMADVIRVLAEHVRGGGDGMSGRDIETALKGDHSQKMIRAGAKLAVECGLVVTREGDKRAVLHTIKHPCSICYLPTAAGSSRHQECAQ